MNLTELQKNWDLFAKTDPFWAILTWPDKKDNKWKEAEFFETGVREVSGVMQYVESLGITLQRRKALDFGCGVGRLSQALACYFEEVWGVDISPTMVELAEKYNKMGDKCRYLVNARRHLGLFKTDTFDFIYTSYVLQHVEPQYGKNYIKEFVRILVPHGLLVFQQPGERGAVSNQDKVDKERFGLERTEACLMRGLWKFVKSVTPEILLEAYRRFRRGKVKDVDEPRMEMFVVRRETVVNVIEECGGKIVDIVENQACGPEYVSYRYAVTKG